MSIRKVVDLPFINADQLSAYASGSYIETSQPISGTAHFESKRLDCSAFKQFAIREISAKNYFPTGIHISAMQSNKVDIVGPLSVNAYEFPSSKPKIPYSESYPMAVYISGNGVTFESYEYLSLSSDGNLRMNIGTEGNLHIYDDKTVELKTGTENELLISCQTYFSDAPLITQGPQTILNSPNYLKSMVPVDLIKYSAKKLIDDTIEKHKFKKLAYYDFKIVSNYPRINLKDNCFYFVTTPIINMY